MTRDVTITPVVEAIIGQEYAAEIRRGPWPDDFTCVKCGGEGFISTGIPVSIAVVVHPDGHRISILHASCGESAAYESDEPAPSMGDHASLTVIVRGSEDDPKAACLFSMSTMIMGASEPGADRTGLLVAKLLEDGFQPALGNPLVDFQGGPDVPGWLVRCSPGSVSIIDGQGHEAYAGEIAPEWTPWLSALREEGRCLFIGGDGIELDTDPMSGLASAVRAGRVAAGVIRAEVNDGLRPKRAERRAMERKKHKRPR